MKVDKNTIAMRQPDDWHAHLREGKLMEDIISLFNVYDRVVCMGNLGEPVDNLQKYITYWNNLIKKGRFQPIIGVMLTKNLTRERLATLLNIFYGQFFLKYMPQGITTNSEYGIPWEELKNFHPVLKLAECRRIPIMIHAEADRNLAGFPVDELWQEGAAVAFVEDLAFDFPDAIINVEHVSTRDMVDLINRRNNLSGSISPNHLAHCYGDVVGDGHMIKDVHKYFKPIAKLESDQDAVIRAALSGDPKFFFGSDCAPHRREDKEQSQRAGAFNALTNLAFLAELFERHGALDERFENFVSNNGAARYHFTLNTGTVKLRRQNWQVPNNYYGIVPDLAGRIMTWQMVT